MTLKGESQSDLTILRRRVTFAQARAARLFHNYEVASEELAALEAELAEAEQ